MNSVEEELVKAIEMEELEKMVDVPFFYLDYMNENGVYVTMRWG